MGARDDQLDQRRYYERTAKAYDGMHGAEDEHATALARIAETLSAIGGRSVLDVGCGTGRGIKYLLDLDRGLDVRGVEPVEAMVERAVENGVPRDRIAIAAGERLPFEDRSFDAVMAIGVLHHVPDPAAVVAEMKRVAGSALFISDANRFGRGPVPLGALKFLLAKAHLWQFAYRLRTRGRGYAVTEEDGVAYSYSVYDSVPQIEGWADRLEITATVPARAESRFHPLLTASHVLLTATLRRSSEPSL